MFNKSLSLSVCLSVVCIYVNKHVNTGPNLDRQKVLKLPDHLGPARPSVVLQQAVQGCIDSAYLQKTVFTLLTQGYGGEKMSGKYTHTHTHTQSCLCLQTHSGLRIQV